MEGPKAGKNPDLDIRYNADMQTLTIDLWDKDHKRTTGMAWHIPVKEIAADYVKERNSPTAWDKTWNDMFGGLGAIKRQTEEDLKNVPALPAFLQ